MIHVTLFKKGNLSNFVNWGTAQDCFTWFLLLVYAYIRQCHHFDDNVYQIAREHDFSTFFIFCLQTTYELPTSAVSPEYAFTEMFEETET